MFHQLLVPLWKGARERVCHSEDSFEGLGQTPRKGEDLGGTLLDHGDLGRGR